MRATILMLASSLALTSIVAASFQNEPLPGKAHYDRVCAGCHGPTAQGDAGPGLLPMTMDYDELLARVRQGGGEMPAISKEKLGDEQVKLVLEYLKSL
jgi:mono/diheme cytochrome c family protein